MAFEARPFEPSDAEAMIAFHLENGGSPTSPEFYRWKYADCPSTLVLENGRIVGRWCFMPYPLEVRGEKVKAAMIVDLDVHPDYRGTRAFPKLRRASRKLLVENGYAVQFGITHWRVVDLGLHIGFDLAGTMTKLVRVLNPVSYLPGLRGGSIGRFLERRLAERASGEAEARLAREGLRPVTSFDSRFDRLLAQPAPVPICRARDTEYLNWRFFRCPAAEYRVYASYDGDDVQAYVVLQDFWRNGTRYGLLSDLAWNRERPALRRSLVRGSVRHFARLGARSVTCWTNPVPSLWPRLLPRGFLPRKTDLYICIELLSEDLDRELFLDRKSWSFTIGDTDHYLAPRLESPAKSMEEQRG